MCALKCDKGVQVGCSLGMIRESSTQVEVCSSTEPQSSTEETDGFMSYDRLLTEVLWNKESALRWCQDVGLIAREETCYICGDLMKLIKTTDRLDGVKWQCRVRGLDRYRHRIIKSIRSNSWFENSNLSIEEILKFTFLWSVGLRQNQIRKQLNLSDHTANAWDRLCREACEVVMMSVSSEDKQIGGIGKVVHVEESKVSKRANYKGNSSECHLVYGGREEDSRNTFLVTVENHDGETLLPVIKQWIAPGTTIVSDCFHAFSDELIELGFSLHETSSYYSELFEEAPEQSMRQTARKQDSSYLAETLYRYAHHGDDIFQSLMKDIAKIFNPNRVV